MCHWMEPLKDIQIIMFFIPVPLVLVHLMLLNFIGHTFDCFAVFTRLICPCVYQKCITVVLKYDLFSPHNCS